MCDSDARPADWIVVCTAGWCAYREDAIKQLQEVVCYIECYDDG
jgi:hypothetical protein